MINDKYSVHGSRGVSQELDDVIKLLGLKPLNGEGGMWSRGYISDEAIPGGSLKGRDTERMLCSTIYYLLTPGSFSRMHSLASDEVWYHHTGAPVKLLLIHPDGTSEVKVLGSDLTSGERPQIAVRRGTYMGAVMAVHDDPRLSGSQYALMSTSNAPSYADEDFTAGTYEELSAFVSDEHLGLLRLLTGNPVFR